MPSSSRPLTQESLLLGTIVPGSLAIPLKACFAQIEDWRMQNSLGPERKLSSDPFPILRWVALLLFAAWFPAYAHYWGWANFLHVCDAAVILTCAGLWWGNSALLSSQALNAVLADFLWCLDAGWRIVFGKHLIGGTEYMWDSHYPFWLRLISLFHIFLPILLVWAVNRVGYDRRALALQSGILVVLLIASRFFDPALNINYAFLDPVFHRSWGSGPVHLFVIWLAMVIFTYWPVAWVLQKFLPQAGSLNLTTSS
jgi:hypothetical protein